jgi:hypothetical protein
MGAQELNQLINPVSEGSTSAVTTARFPDFVQQHWIGPSTSSKPVFENFRNYAGDSPRSGSGSCRRGKEAVVCTVVATTNVAPLISKINPPTPISYSQAVSSANLDALPENCPYAPAGHLLRSLWLSIMYNNHALDGHHPTDETQRISGPPSDAEFCMYVALAAVPAANSRPGTRPEPAPTTHTGGTDGIQPAAGSPPTPGRCRPAHGGGWCGVWCEGVRTKPHRGGAMPIGATGAKPRS